MSAFTFTAPYITEEEEKAERDALSETELRAIHRDVYGSYRNCPRRYKNGGGAMPSRGLCGSSNYNQQQQQQQQQPHAEKDGTQYGEVEEDVEEEMDSDQETDHVMSESMIVNAIAMMDEAMESIPHADKAAHLEALDRVPALVAKESPFLLFLQYEKGDVLAAAVRLASYWKQRKIFFGPDRAFMPMTLQGAMAPDVPYLEKGVLLILSKDAHGRQVFFFDRTRCVASVVPRPSMLRCLFYVSQVIVHHHEGDTNGIVAVVNMRGYDLYKHFDRIWSKKWMELIKYGFPIKVNAIHCCTGSGKSVVDLVIPMLKHMAGREMRLRNFLHAGSSTVILERVRNFGLSAEHVDPLTNGLLPKLEMARAWLAERRQVEEREQQELVLSA